MEGTHLTPSEIDRAVSLANGSIQASQLIARLQELVNQYGDLPIYTGDQEFGDVNYILHADDVTFADTVKDSTGDRILYGKRFVIN